MAEQTLSPKAQLWTNICEPC